MVVVAALLAAFIGSPEGLPYRTPAARVAQTASACLHDKTTETAEQLARRRQALGLARTINSAEAAYSAQHGGGYAPFADLIGGDFVKQPPSSGEHVAGFEVRLDAGPKGYWFEVVDKTDACGFRYISNQNGTIFEARPIQ